uniref:U6 snRNA-associated Sm-like protein LSm3 n=1 Tax=Panagrolaimus sp. ES5 TaxID=591445 RepID=A0AC34EZS6_9BILA
MSQNNGDEGSADLTTNVEEPIDFVRLALNEHVMIKMRQDRHIFGILQSFDQHLNLIISDVVETVNTSEIDPDSAEEIIHTTTREIPLLYVRGDSVILVSKPNRNPN